MGTSLTLPDWQIDSQANTFIVLAIDGHDDTAIDTPDQKPERYHQMGKGPFG